MERYIIDSDVKSNICGILVISENGEGYLHYLDMYLTQNLEDFDKLSEENQWDINDIVHKANQICNRNGFNLIAF